MVGYEEEAEIGAEGTELAPAPNSRLSLCSRSCVLACLKKKKKRREEKKEGKKKKFLSRTKRLFSLFSRVEGKNCATRDRISCL